MSEQLPESLLRYQLTQSRAEVRRLRDLLAQARRVLEMIPPPLSDCYTNGLQPDIYDAIGPDRATQPSAPPAPPPPQE